METNIDKNNAKRQSGIELMRIVAMFMVVAHHFVVNSGIDELFDLSKPLSWNTQFLQWFGMWGKTAINAFVLVSGYFMSTSRLTVRRILKLYLEVQFYVVVCFVLLCMAGYEHLSGGRLIDLLFWPLTGLNRGFTSSFMVFYLFIPLYNVVVSRLARRQLLFWTGMLVCIYVIPYTCLGNHDVFNYVGWYVALYFTGACVKKEEGMRWMSRNQIIFPLLVVMIAGAMFGSWLYGWNVRNGWPCLPFKCIGTFFGVAESCSLMSYVIGILTFLFFKNLRIPYNPFINGIASTVFGVFLIHTVSSAMRTFLWRDLVDVVGHYQDAEAVGGAIAWFAIAVVTGVFVACAILDYLRISFLERPLFRKLSRVF